MSTCVVEGAESCIQIFRCLLHLLCEKALVLVSCQAQASDDGQRAEVEDAGSARSSKSLQGGFRLFAALCFLGFPQAQSQELETGAAEEASEEALGEEALLGAHEEVHRCSSSCDLSEVEEEAQEEVEEAEAESSHQGQQEAWLREELLTS